MTRKVCVVTGTRADYGLLRWTMDGIQKAAQLELQVVATGMHLSPEFGLTYREIENDGFRIDRRVEMLLSSDSATGVTKSMGLGVIGFADVFAELEPDVVLLLGDRFEIFAAAAAALIARLPIAHIHGGETTEGAFDEALRHSITKMSHLHFVAAEEYRNRVIQLGEDPSRVYLVGGPGVENIHRLKLLDRAELEAELGITLGKKSLLITLHPVTLEENTSAAQTRELLAALETLGDTRLIFTMPNADTDGRDTIRLIEEFVNAHPNASAHKSLGQVRYLSCIRHVDGVVGNSSSGLTEAPTFRKGAVNIGDRQRGRLKAASVIDCAPNRADILRAIERLYSPGFRETLAGVENPYGDGSASARIVETLSTVPLEGIIKKRFHDISAA